MLRDSGSKLTHFMLHLVHLVSSYCAVCFGVFCKGSCLTQMQIDLPLWSRQGIKAAETAIAEVPALFTAFQNFCGH